MSKVHAPFNFVPLTQKVFYPDWAGQISQDIPFEDGLSGTIELSLTAETPIFVRNGHTKEEGKKLKEEGGFETAAMLPDGRFYLPATSVKGCIRSVLEIIGNCKMRVDEKARFAQREWNNSNLYKLKDPKVQKNIKGGWLKQDENGKFVITECEQIYRIGFHAIDELLGGTPMKDNFFGYGKLEENEKLASYKYRLIKEYISDYSKLRGLHFKEDFEVSEGVTWTRVRKSDHGDIVGTIVLTGQPDKAKYWKADREEKKNTGKYYEFVFADSDDPKTHKIQQDIYEQYDHFIYKDNEDWKFAKEELGDKRGIPVFFRLENGKVKDFGLALLYKQPYENTPADIEKRRHDSEKDKQGAPDLAECIFGYIGDKKPLRGRVQFSNFISDNAKESDEYVLILNGPKASYYPIYIKQDGETITMGNYKTYNDGKLSGWKRYHIRNDVWEKCLGDAKLDTKFRSLEKGCKFTGKIHFHNLRPQELGALISAITFHETDKNCFHQIGKGKPYGFGKVKAEITTININGEARSLDNEYVKHTFSCFEELVYNKEWVDVVTELIVMSSQDVPEQGYDYMNLDMTGTNDFNDAKKDKKSLQPFSIHPTSLTNAKEVRQQLMKTEEKRKAEEEVRREAERAAEEKRKAEEEARREEEKKAENAQRKEAKITNGLAFLEEKNSNGEYKVKDFKGIRNRTDQWMKLAQVTELPPEQIKYLDDALNRIQTYGKKAIKDWKDSWIKQVKGEN